MKQRYIPLEKRSKKEQRAYHAAQRKHWGELNPVTHKKESKKTYNRKKAERWNVHEPSGGFFSTYPGSCVVCRLVYTPALFLG